MNQPGQPPQQSGGGTTQKYSTFFRLRESSNKFHKTSTHIKKLWLFLTQTISSITQHQTITMASALAFSTLTAVVPLLLIGIAVANILGTEDGRSYADWFILAVQDRLPDTPELGPLLELLRGITARSSEIAGIGLILLFITAYSLLASVEYALNRIWQVSTRRTFFNRAIAYLATIIIVPVLMSLSVYFSARVETVARRVVNNIEQDGITSLLNLATLTSDKRHNAAADAAEARAANTTKPVTDTPAKTPEIPTTATAPAPATTIKATPPAPLRSIATTAPPQSWALNLFLSGLSFLFTCFALTLLLHFMPCTPVRWSAALYGGLFSGALIELTKYAFSFYAQSATTNLTRLYGTTMLAFPLALLWLWLIWVFILLGAEVAFNIQNYRDLAASAEIERRGLQHRLYLAVRTVLISCELFRNGANPAKLIDRVAERLNVPPFAIRAIVQQLAEKDILRPVRDLEDAYLPARDINALSLYAIIDAIAGNTFTCPTTQQDCAHRVLSELFAETSNQLRVQFGQLTMRQLLEREGFIVPEETE